jgi:hypothetical protein
VGVEELLFLVPFGIVEKGLRRDSCPTIKTAWVYETEIKAIA